MKQIVDTRYINDEVANYISFELDKRMKISDYQLNMLSNNSIDGILPIKVKQIKGRNILYYTLNSNHTLAQFFTDSVSKQDFVRTIKGIIKIILESNRYLLKGQNFVLNQDYIFIDNELSKLYMAYLPIESHENLDVKFREFVSHLLLHTVKFDNSLSGEFLNAIFNYLKSDKIDLEKLDNLLDTLNQQNQPQPIQQVVQVIQQKATVQKEEVKPLVIAITGAGGVGKTFIASELAKIYASQGISTSLASITSQKNLEYYFDISDLVNNIDNKIEHLGTKKQILDIGYKLGTNIIGFQGNHDDKYILNSFLINKLSLVSKIIILCLEELSEDKLLDYADFVLLITKQEKKYDYLTYEYIKKLKGYCFEEQKLLLVINEYYQKAKDKESIAQNINAMLAAHNIENTIDMKNVFAVDYDREALLLGVKSGSVVQHQLRKIVDFMKK